MAKTERKEGKSEAVPLAPASDEAVAALRFHIAAGNTLPIRGCMLHIGALIGRIDADRAKIAEQAEEIERLTKIASVLGQWGSALFSRRAALAEIGSGK